MRFETKMDLPAGFRRFIDRVDQLQGLATLQAANKRRVSASQRLQHTLIAVFMLWPKP